MSDRAWEAHVDATALEDERFDVDAPWLGAEGDAEAELERAVYRELARTGAPEPLDAEDRRRAEATLAEFRSRHPRKAARSWPAAVGGGLAIAAAMVLGWFVLPERDLARPASSAAIVTSGSLMLDEAVLGAEAVMPPDRWVVARTPACIRLGAGTSCVGASARLRAHEGTVEVAEGTLHFTGSGTISTPWGDVAVEEGSLRVEASSTSLALEVEAGRVEVERDRGALTLIEGERHEFGDVARRALEPASPETEAIDSPPAADSDVEEGPARAAASTRTDSTRIMDTTPGQLLRAARDHVAAGKLDRALSAYATLQRRHPQSPEAHTANVSVGEMQLSRRRPAAALKAFDRYLGRGGGPLEEEAHWGRIRALHRLDRLEQRDAAIETLRTEHPRSVYLGQASRL